MSYAIKVDAKVMKEACERVKHLFAENPSFKTLSEYCDASIKFGDGSVTVGPEHCEVVINALNNFDMRFKISPINRHTIYIDGLERIVIGDKLSYSEIIAMSLVTDKEADYDIDYTCKDKYGMYGGNVPKNYDVRIVDGMCFKISRVNSKSIFVQGKKYIVTVNELSYSDVLSFCPSLVNSEEIYGIVYTYSISHMQASGNLWEGNKVTVIDGMTFWIHQIYTKFKLILNGTEVIVTSPTISYEDVVSLINGTSSSTYDITYFCKITNMSGIIHKGQKINVSDGLIINAFVRIENKIGESNA